MGLVGGNRQYDGPGLGAGPWKCPACGEANTGAIDAGCLHCGSGSAAPRHVGQPPPVERRAGKTPLTGHPLDENGAIDLHLTPAFTAVKADLDRGMEVYAAANAWALTHDAEGLEAAFLAGYQLAVQQLTARTMLAPPLAADIATLAPDGKARRTIIAALDLFKDQVLRDARDEIASGEWCSLEEVEQLIIDLKQQEEEV